MDYIAIFKDVYDWVEIERMEESGKYGIIDSFIAWNEVFNGKGVEAMEAIEWEMGIYLMVSQYNDVVVNDTF